jgi:hypothetical protein
MALTTLSGSTITTLSGVPLLATPPSQPPLPGIPFELLRVRIGLLPTDTSRDLEIQMIWDGAIVSLENYLDRYLRPGDYVETFTHIVRNVISLKGYPVTAVASIVNSFGADVMAYHVEPLTGLVHFDGTLISHEAVISYTANPPLNGIMLVPVLALFDTLWGGYAGAGQVAVGGGAVKAISQDGARIEFDTSSGGAVASGLDAATSMPAAFLGMLEAYRRKSC